MEFPNHISTMAIFWLAIVAIVFFSNFFSYRARASHHRMIEKLVDSGQPVPPELFRNGERPSGRRNHPVSSGIYLMCIGVALAVFMWAMTGGGNPLEDLGGRGWLPVIGIFPFMIGVARILASLFDRRPTQS